MTSIIDSIHLSLGLTADTYLAKHKTRMEKTLPLIPDLNGGKALDVGYSPIVSFYLHSIAKAAEVHSTKYGTDYSISCIRSNNCSKVIIHTLDLEHHRFDVSDSYFDFISILEVVEHFEIDPMFALIELNRIHKLGGKLLLTTPNSCSARNLNKMILGYRPHFYMQYQTTRTLGRHNFEHDVHSITILLRAAGYSIDSICTWDVFEAKEEIICPQLRKFSRFDQRFRGDDIFCVATKISETIERFPNEIYCPGC